MAHQTLQSSAVLAEDGEPGGGRLGNLRGDPDGDTYQSTGQGTKLLTSNVGGSTDSIADFR